MGKLRSFNFLVLLVTLVGLCVAEMEMVIYTDLKNSEIRPTDILKFALFAGIDSLGGSEMAEYGEVNFCLLLDAYPCACESSTTGNPILDMQSQKVMRHFNIILPASCIPSDEKSGSLHSFAVEIFSSKEGKKGSEISAPYYFSDGIVSYDMITLVLPLTIADMRRSLILFRGLQDLPRRLVSELLILCPHNQTNVIANELTSFYDSKGKGIGLDFRIQVADENVVFGDPIPSSADKYGLQMALKLLASKLVRTPFYVTLDADLVLLKPGLLPYVLLEGGKKAVFEDEDRRVHADWWTGSARFLGLNSVDKPMEKILDSSNGAGFGVTPSVLSTFGAQLTAREVFRRVDTCFSGKTRENTRIIDSERTLKRHHASLERTWLLHFLKFYDSRLVSRDIDLSKSPKKSTNIGDSQGTSTGDSISDDDHRQCMNDNERVLWSEYTLYRLVLDHKGIFTTLHSPTVQPRDAEKHAAQVVSDPLFSQLGSVSNIPEPSTNKTALLPPALHCFDVWYQGDLPWKSFSALHEATRCIFSVVQSSSKVDPRDIETLLGWVCEEQSCNIV